MSVSHQRVGQAWKDKKRGKHVCSNYCACAVIRTILCGTLFIRCVYLGTVPCAYEKEKKPIEF